MELFKTIGKVGEFNNTKTSDHLNYSMVDSHQHFTFNDLWLHFMISALYFLFSYVHFLSFMKVGTMFTPLNFMCWTSRVPKYLPSPHWVSKFFTQHIKKGRGAWVAELVKHGTLGFASAPDLRIMKWSPVIGFVQSLLKFLSSLSFCPSPLCTHVCALSLSNK